MEALETQQFEPVWMSAPRHQLGRAFARPLGDLTADEAAMIEEELQQAQVGVAQCLAQEKRVAQAGVKILHQGAGPRGLGEGLTHSLHQRVKPP